ncbi:MAG: hypothetical protein PIR02_12540 [Microbacterium enclense]
MELVVCDRETLQGWVDEFLSAGYVVAGSIRVLPHDAEDGDTGLIKLELRNAHTTTVLHPSDDDSGRWHVVFEARETDLSLTAAQALQLGCELTIAGVLCTFLETKAVVKLSLDAQK